MLWTGPRRVDSLSFIWRLSARRVARHRTPCIMQRGQSLMDKLLERLAAYIAAHPQTAFFNTPATSDEIAAVESALGVPLPNEYRAFLARHNGGFIDVSEIGPEALPDAAWNSNTLLGTVQLMKEYRQWANIGADVFGFQGKWPYIPFCQTEGQELLVFGPSTAGRAAPVLDAFHEMPPDEWSERYPSFTAFLEAYLDGEGNVNTIA